MKLSKINNGLLGLIILINAYIIVAPLLPWLSFHLQSHQGKQQQLTQIIHTPRKHGSNKALLTNHLVVPAMLLDTPVRDGPVSQQYAVLDKGVWRWPLGSTPDKGGNTVLIGHRFTYTNPRGIFYYLNKVKMGDEIALYWQRHEYLYKVASISEVPASDTAIENPTSQSRLTLFTCTPLWLPKNRLVVVANLESKL